MPNFQHFQLYSNNFARLESIFSACCTCTCACTCTCTSALWCTWNIGSLCRCWVMDRLMLGLKVMQAPAPSLSLTPLSSSREAPGLEVPNEKEYTTMYSWRLHVHVWETPKTYGNLWEPLGTYENNRELMRTYENHRELWEPITYNKHFSHL